MDEFRVHPGSWRKEIHMRPYEITFITRSEESDAGVSDLIAQCDGRIEVRQVPVRRKFAYPIDKEQAGVYYTYEFTMDRTRLAELNHKLDRNEEVVRHLIIADGIRKSTAEPRKLKDKDLEVAESLTRGMAEIAADDAAREAIAAKAVEQPAQAEVVEEPVTPTEPAHEATAEELTADERQKKLDEKLKNILGE